MLQGFLHVQLHLISALAAVTTVTAISLALRRASTATSLLLGCECRENAKAALS